MGQVTSLFARKVVSAAGDKIDPVRVLASVGLEIDAPWDPKAMISAEAYYAMLEQIAEEIDVTALPVQVGASMQTDEYGALGLAWKAAPNLLGSLARVERYARLWTSVVSYELRDTSDGALYILHREGPNRLGISLSNETSLIATVSIARQVCPVPLAPLRAFFRHPPPPTKEHHERYLDCPVDFDADHNALLFSKASLVQPNILGDEGITKFLVSHLDQELAGIDDTPTLQAQIKGEIARALSEGLPKMADIARRLGLSARSFHRRLAEQGMSFQTLTEETRREIAIAMLRDDRYALAEIAFLTGYSEQSAFNRAFKRWTGVTPAAYRKSHS
ncbi:AraC family transcriptional regulator [Cognatiyoonia sp. IB215182]|uniref:AraC family transcriptional regulator n=1 Tax=Cognatiyoonia sp. IB215182 TaxID=3097353 RepID=UPI002A0D5FCD|nr:AraC family transcriptional regulator [Cognatiyoonia sp. IB215182]MDX8351018.1 AraC family transcriptional regulator [Cognatiyoonia sp. IB215182]